MNDIDSLGTRMTQVQSQALLLEHEIKNQNEILAISENEFEEATHHLNACSNRVAEAQRISHRIRCRLEALGESKTNLDQIQNSILSWDCWAGHLLTRVAFNVMHASSDPLRAKFWRLPASDRDTAVRCWNETATELLLVLKLNPWRTSHISDTERHLLVTLMADSEKNAECKSWNLQSLINARIFAHANEELDAARNSLVVARNNLQQARASHSIQLQELSANLTDCDMEISRYQQLIQVASNEATAAQTATNELATGTLPFRDANTQGKDSSLTRNKI